MSHVAPVTGTQVIRKGVGQILSFIHGLGYLGQVELVGDGEEAMPTLISSLEETRSRMGYPTNSNSGRPYNKRRAAKAERLTQT